MSDLEFVVVRTPIHGRLVRYQDDMMTSVTQFNAEDLTAGRIAYEHDDETSPSTGEATTDMFGVMARLWALGKRSGPCTVHVAVSARNIQPPYLINHGVLKVNIGIQNSIFTHLYRYLSFRRHT